jgi:hypothetical protein
VATDGWTKAGVIVNGVGALLVVITIKFAGIQIGDARRALQATTLYNVEKDYSAVFKPISTGNFQACFGPNTNAASTIPVPEVCEIEEARAELFDLLQHYRLLLDLEKDQALTPDYVNARLKAACVFLRNNGTIDTMMDFDRKKALDAGLKERIVLNCGVKL